MESLEKREGGQTESAIRSPYALRQTHSATHNPHALPYR